MEQNCILNQHQVLPLVFLSSCRPPGISSATLDTMMARLLIETSVQVSVEWAKTLGQKLERASWAGFGALHSVLPADTAAQLLDAACSLLKQEPSLVDVSLDRFNYSRFAVVLLA